MIMCSVWKFEEKVKNTFLWLMFRYLGKNPPQDDGYPREKPVKGVIRGISAVRIAFVPAWPFDLIYVIAD